MQTLLSRVPAQLTRACSSRTERGRDGMRWSGPTPPSRRTRARGYYARATRVLASVTSALRWEPVSGVRWPDAGPRPDAAHPARAPFGWLGRPRELARVCVGWAQANLCGVGLRVLGGMGSSGLSVRASAATGLALGPTKVDLQPVLMLWCRRAVVPQPARGCSQAQEVAAPLEHRVGGSAEAVERTVGNRAIRPALLLARIASAPTRLGSRARCAASLHD